MKALTFHAHGGPEVLRYEDVPAPTPGRGEVLLRVKAVALNRLDLFVREGWPGLKLQMPHIGGCDAAGIVEAVGEGVEGWTIGQRVLVDPSMSCGHCAACEEGERSLCPDFRVWGEHLRGGAAELAVAPAENLLAIPDHVSFEEAAASPLVYQTAWRMLITRGRLRAGETVLVVGAGGGVNSAAIQIAKLAGARVLAVAGGDEKAEHAREIGADEVIDYRAQPDWDREVMRRTGKRGVDVVVDNVGEQTWIKSIKCAAKGGRIVTVGGTTGYNPPAAINYIMWKQLDILGSTMGSRREFLTAMDLVFQGRLKPIIAAVMPLSRGIEAQEMLAKGEGFGKIVLVP